MDFSFMNNKTLIYIGLAIFVIIAIYYLYNYLYNYFFKKPAHETQKLINDNISNDENNNVSNNVSNNVNESYENQEKPVHEIDIHSGNPYFIIGIDGEPVGKMKFELFDDDVPKTCANFRHLCAKGLDGGNEACYKNSIFHRVIENFMIQGGDFTNFNGTGGLSIYGEKFEDENFNLKHNQPGLLSMANSGPNTNGSQFFVTLAETPHLDDKHVVFGILLEGFEILKKIEKIETDDNNKPKQVVKIIDCGIDYN